MVLSQYRIQQRLWSISSTFQLTDHVLFVVGCGNAAVKVGVVSCAILGENIETSWVTSRGGWRSQC